MSRRGSIAEQLEALRRFVTEPDHTPEPMQTNWSVTPANDNNPEDLDGLKIDHLWDISPSPEEIMRQVKGNPEEKNERGQTVKWGTLRFSDGGQTEQGFKLTIDNKVVVYQFVVPPGGMLGTTDKERAQRGGDDDSGEVTKSNQHFGGKETDEKVAGIFKASFARPVKRTKRKERTGPRTKAEERQWLEDAIAGTAVMPTVKKCPDGFPYGPANLAHLFPGLVKTATGDSGSQSWEDIHSERESRMEFFKWVERLPSEHRAALDAAKAAKTFTDVGVAVGQSQKYAKYNGGGRRALIAANDNLMEVIKKYSA